MIQNTKHLLAICTAALTLLAIPTAARAADESSPEKAKPYPLDTCVVSGEKLGSMGDPVVINHNGQEVKFCCKDCVKQFNKEPEKFLKKLQEAESSTTENDPHAHHQH